MWDYKRGYLPKIFDTYFTKVSKIHSYETRSSVAGNLAQNLTIRTKSNGSKMFKIKGVSILNEINKYDFFKNSRKKESFSCQFKKYLIDLY